MSSKPLIVLVHGALTDASVWNSVAEQLQRNGYTTLAPAMPLRSLHADAEYLSSILTTVEGPVVLIGHSYGGSVISHPILTKHALISLVFVSAFLQDSGETARELNGRWPGSKLGETTAVIRPYPGGNDLYLKADSFAEVYAGDMSPQQARILAAAQRPIDPKALGESFIESPTWRNVPTWVVVSTEDSSIPTEAQRLMAARARATMIEVAASHASPLSQAKAVAEHIMSATR
jgi:pimeloyl-ACP methyl ester carboxylesterase